MVLLLWLAGSVAQASGFEVAQQAGAAGGTGHAGTAREDASSAFFNPAALADGQGVRAMVGLAAASSWIRAEGPGFETRTENGVATPPHLYLSGSVGPVAAGVATHFGFAGGVAWPADGPLRFESIASEPRFLRVAPFLAGRLGPVRISGGVHIDRGYLAVTRATDHVAEEGTVDLALRGGGVGPDASVWVDAGSVRFGASYKGRTALSLSGEADFEVPEAFQPGFPDQQITADWTLPDRVSLGTAATVDNTVVLLDVVLTTWGVNDQLVIAMSDPATSDVVQDNRWRDSLAVRGGVEAVFDTVTARGGMYLDGLPRPPSPRETLGPSSPDMARLAGTAGFGVEAGPVRVDGYGELMALLPRESESADATLATYRGMAVVAGVSVELLPTAGSRAEGR